MVRVTTRTTKKGQRNTSRKCLASINTSTYKMASDYIYKEKINKNKTTKQYEDGASVRKKTVFSFTAIRNKHIHTLRKILVLNFLFLKSSTDLSCV